MKKVKTMENCLGTGKVCCKVRSEYNQLADILSKIKLLEAKEYDLDDKVSELLLDAFTTVQAKLSQTIRKTCLKCEIAERLKIAKAKAENDVDVAKQVLLVAEENLKNKMEVLEGFYS